MFCAELQHPIYAVVRSFLARCNAIPTIAELNAFKDENSLLSHYQFVHQTRESSSLSYEESIYHQGKIMTREQHWHDCFNAMIWMTFPRTKACLNAAQCQDFSLTKSKQRTYRQNLLAHFDEDGVILIYQSPSVIDAIVHHKWFELFYEQRQSYGRHWQIWGFGHGLLEKCLVPYIGLTAKALLIQVDKSFFNLSINEQHVYIDALLASAIKHRIEFVQDFRLQPIPLLGVPGWTTSQSVDFYQNKDYFRLKNRQSKPVIILK